MEDAIVCGGGPAGLAAAMWLGRYRRRTVVLDAGHGRNSKAQASHGYLSRDGSSPADLMEAARRDALRYPTVELVAETAASAQSVDGGFEVSTETGAVLRSKRVVIATGVEDAHPDIPGFEDLYGVHIFHCSCCDGYESSDQDVLAIGWGEHVAGFALDLLDWGARVTLVTNGQEFEGDRACIAALDRNSIEIVEDRIVSFEVEGNAMRSCTTASGRTIPATRAFFSIEHRPRTGLAVALGCEVDELGYVVVGAHGETSVDGVYACGDVTPGEQLVQTAAAEGAITGIACGMSLRGERTSPLAPDPGPDPVEELSEAQTRSSAT